MPCDPVRHAKLSVQQNLDSTLPTSLVRLHSHRMAGYSHFSVLMFKAQVQKPAYLPSVQHAKPHCQELLYLPSPPQGVTGPTPGTHHSGREEEEQLVGQAVA